MKTLAKAANKVAKKGDGVRVLKRPEQVEAVLARLAVEDVWGIGRFGAGTLFYAGAGIRRLWAMQRGMKSPHYTTDWEALRVHPQKVVPCRTLPALPHRSDRQPGM
ncbi:MAG TPA: DUF4113 domain-containing protein [Gemmataceae bacterium]|nr:DUF4113 domain-containing protein [Gemmataceae bacterium]